MQPSPSMLSADGWSSPRGRRSPDEAESRTVSGDLYDLDRRTASVPDQTSSRMQGIECRESLPSYPATMNRLGSMELHRRLSAACKAAVGGAYGADLRQRRLQRRDARAVARAGRARSARSRVNLTRNFGHQLALSAGLTVCRNELVFVLDADLQDPPELLTPMLQLIEEGADVVYGQRRERAGESVFKSVGGGVLPAARPHVGGPRSARHRRFQANDTAGRRCVERDARAAPFIRGMVSWSAFARFRCSTTVMSAMLERPNFRFAR